MFKTQDSKPISQLVPAASARAHVGQLIAAGLTPTLIARMANLDARRVLTLVENRTERGHRRIEGPNGRFEHRIARRTSEALLAIPVPKGMFVLATGPVRRLRALVRIGYPFDVLAGVLGFDETLLRELALGAPEVVDVELTELLADLYDRWHCTPGPSDAARELGRRHRFAAPLAWAIDDEEAAHAAAIARGDAFDHGHPIPGSIDDPDASPAGLPPVETRGVPADFADIVDDHRDLGHFDEDIAAAMGLSLNTFAKRLHRAGLNERRRGTGLHNTRPPLYGARYTMRIPVHTGASRRLLGLAS